MNHCKRVKWQGFTLLELLMVVVVLAILAAIALPQYLRAAERARMSEAISTLGAVRSSQVRYMAEFGTYHQPPGAGLGNLDMAGVFASSATPLFTVGVPLGDAATFCAVATRTAQDFSQLGACTANYTVRINHTGAIFGRDCRSISDQCV